MSGSNDGSGSWGSRFVKVASVAAATAGGSRGSTFLKVASVAAATAGGILGFTFLTGAGVAATTAGVSWGSRFVKVASAAATTATVASALYEHFSSSGASELEVPFGTQREGRERDVGDPLSSYPEAPLILQVHMGDPLIWKKPEIGWVKLNVDGSRDHHSAGCGGVLRDSSGEWLHGFAQKLNPNYEAHQTELQAILKGLELTWKVKDANKIQKLVVESDCDPALIMVKNGVNSYDDDYDVVERIRKFCFDRNWEVKLVSIAKEPDQDESKANGVADILANYARALSCYGLCKYRWPPAKCIELLNKDKQGV